MMKMQVKRKLYRYEEEEDGGKRSSKQWCMVAKGRSSPLGSSSSKRRRKEAFGREGRKVKRRGGVINNSYQYTWGTEKRGNACEMGLPLYKLQVVVRE